MAEIMATEHTLPGSLRKAWCQLRPLLAVMEVGWVRWWPVFCKQVNACLIPISPHVFSKMFPNTVQSHLLE